MSIDEFQMYTLCRILCQIEEKQDFQFCDSENLSLKRKAKLVGKKSIFSIHEILEFISTYIRIE